MLMCKSVSLFFSTVGQKPFKTHLNFTVLLAKTIITHYSGAHSNVFRYEVLIKVLVKSQFSIEEEDKMGRNVHSYGLFLSVV